MKFSKTGKPVILVAKLEVISCLHLYGSSKIKVGKECMMAFGISKKELAQWKAHAREGEISFLTHFWYDPRFPEHKTVTKAACTDWDKLVAWGRKYGLKEEWIHKREKYPHFDLIGDTEKFILEQEGQMKKLTDLEKLSAASKA